MINHIITEHIPCMGIRKEPLEYPLTEFQSTTPAAQKKIYIAGKVTGLPFIEVSHKFGQVELKIKKEGHIPVCPLNIVDQHQDNWHTAMRKCITALMGCDEVYFLPCWVNSRGAVLEHTICTLMDLKITLLENTASL